MLLRFFRAGGGGGLAKLSLCAITLIYCIIITALFLISFALTLLPQAGQGGGLIKLLLSALTLIYCIIITALFLIVFALTLLPQAGQGGGLAQLRGGGVGGYGARARALRCVRCLHPQPPPSLHRVQLGPLHCVRKVCVRVCVCERERERGVLDMCLCTALSPSPADTFTAQRATGTWALCAQGGSIGRAVGWRFGQPGLHNAICRPPGTPVQVCTESGTSSCRSSTRFQTFRAANSNRTCVCARERAKGRFSPLVLPNVL